MDTPSAKDMRYIAKALEASTASDVHRTKLGAVITNGRRIVGQACNITRTHPIQARYNYITNNARPRDMLHAEIHALIRAGDADVRGCTVYVARYDKRGRLAHAKPCKACDMALRRSGVKRVVYTTPEGIKEYGIQKT